MTDRLSVLLVYVHNAGRSQMAAGDLQHIGGGHIEVRSAGSAPGDRVNPVAVEAMHEEGIDIAGARPRMLTEDAVQASDVVITMGRGRRVSVRPIRDEIRRRVEALVVDLLGPAA